MRHGPSDFALPLNDSLCISSSILDSLSSTMKPILASVSIPPLLSSFSSPLGSPMSSLPKPLDNLHSVLRTTTSPLHSLSTWPSVHSLITPARSPASYPESSYSFPLSDSQKGLVISLSTNLEVESSSSKAPCILDVPESELLPPSIECERSSLLSTTPVPSGTCPASTTLTPSKVSHCVVPQLSVSKLRSSNGDLGSRFSDASDCSPLSSKHFVIVPSGVGNISPSLLDIRSVKGETVPNPGPPSVPSPDSVPRKPARGGQKGEGWPYAPQGWPNHNDKWFWKVGKRLHHNGYFRDRFLGLPRGLCKGKQVTEFASKKSLVVFLEKNFPDVSVENFFKSFQWRVPHGSYRNSHVSRALKVNTVKRQRPAEEQAFYTSAKKHKKVCRAGNSKCALETGKSSLVADGAASTCDICCTEPTFCRECKCILCCQTILLEGGECFFVRCLQMPSGDGICGHAAHLECALRSSRAGVVKDRGLDMEYLCRRCDKRTDLRELVTQLIEMVGNTDKRKQAEKSLVLALEVMKGTEHGGNGARALESLLQTALKKVQSGVSVREVFSDLKDQGAAAEAAKQPNFGRGLSLLEDVSQQPEASLDQWLPSSSSPSSHHSPTTPSSLTSPFESNPTVNSCQLNWVKHTDAYVGKHRGGLVTQHDIKSLWKLTHSPAANKSIITNAGTARGSHRVHAVSSLMNTAIETKYDFQTKGTSGNQFEESGPRDDKLHFGTKDQNDRCPAARFRGGSKICRSCGRCRCQDINALEVTSGRNQDKRSKEGLERFAICMEQKGGSLAMYTEQGEDDSDNKHSVEYDAGSRCLSNISSLHGLTVMGTSLELLNSECQEDVLETLQKLRKAQDAEFECAKLCLNAQTENILKQYELVEIARLQFSDQIIPTSLEVFDNRMMTLTKQLAKATEERENFKSMLKVADGFGSVSKDDLGRFYHWPLGRS